MIPGKNNIGVMNADDMNAVIDRANLVRLARESGGKVSSAKVFAVCPDCKDILNVDNCACRCSQYDNGRWRKMTGGWQYIPGIKGA